MRRRRKRGRRSTEIAVVEGAIDAAVAVGADVLDGGGGDDGGGDGCDLRLLNWDPLCPLALFQVYDQIFGFAAVQQGKFDETWKESKDYQKNRNNQL